MQEAAAYKIPDDYFIHMRKVLVMLGISFTGNETLCYRICSTIWVITLVITYGILELLEAYLNMDNQDVLVNILSVIKLIVLLHYRLRIGGILTTLQSGVFAPDVKRGGIFEYKLVIKFIKLSTRQALIYQTLCMMVISLGIIGTLIRRVLHSDPSKWELPFMPFSLVDTKVSPNYEIVWFYQGVYRILYCMIVTSTDTLIGAVLAHMSAQCQLLQNAIRRLMENAYNEAIEESDIFLQNIKDPNDIDPSLVPWHILEKHTKQTIEYHLAILGVADEFEEIFTILILCEFLATLLILCFCMYHASLFDLFSMRAAQDFSYVGAISVQIFLCCYWGNEVTLQSQEIAVACYDANFVGADLRFQKALISVIRRCQTPIVLTAAKFTDLSLKTYVWIIRASYSYYMVLRSQQVN